MSMRPVATEVIAKPTTSTQALEKGQRSTFSALRHPAFRLFFAGQMISLTGTWVQAVAQQIVVYNLTSSEFALGAVACAQGLPSLLLAPFSGVIAERFPRRKILVVTQTLMMITAFLLGVLQLSGNLQIWQVVILAFITGIGNALDAPARLSFFMEMVGREDLPSGIVLNSFIFNIARVVGPTIGGIALQTIGEGWCFILNGISFLAVIASLLLMKITPMPRTSSKGSFLRAFAEGLAFVRKHDVIGPLLLLSALTCLSAINFSVLLPSYADEVLRDTKGGTSAMLIVQGVGALMGAIFLARMNNSGRRGWVLAIGACVAPLAVLMIAFAQTYWVALPMSGLAGFCFVCQFVYTNALLQQNLPDSFRGRVLSLYSVTFFGLSPFGGILIGITGEFFGSVTAMLVFGTVGLSSALFVMRYAPKVRQMA
jgi:MFS family permease